MPVRTVARNFSVGGFAVLRGALHLCGGGVDILKIDQISTDVLCFMFQFGGFGALFGGAKPTKAPK